MSVRITHPTEAVLYCSTTGIAFGPVFDSHADAEDFSDWLGRDARFFTAEELLEQYVEWQLVVGQVDVA
jgi:hypothetical protein